MSTFGLNTLTPYSIKVHFFGYFPHFTLSKAILNLLQSREHTGTRCGKFYLRIHGPDSLLGHCHTRGYLKKERVQVTENDHSLLIRVNICLPTKQLGVRMNSFKRVRAFQIELEFGSVGFWGEGKTGVSGEKPLEARENQQQTQPTYGVDAGSWTRATLVRGERSHQCAIPCSPNIKLKSLLKLIPVKLIMNWWA